MEAKGLSKDSQRTALLLHCAGQDVQDIFDTLTDPGPVPDGDTEYAKAMRSLDGYFFPQVNIPFERHEFRQAKQDESETADQFVMKLFQLSEHCDFGEAKEEHIRDQLIDKCKSHNLRKKLLEAGGTLTLQKAREIARSMEAAERQAKQIENDSRGEHVHTLEDHHHVSGRGKRGCCYRCGIEGHFARDPECKARSVTCSKCRKIGHLAKCCRTKVENNSKRGNVHQISEDDFAFSVQSDIRDIPTIDIELGGIQLEGVLVDSGSTCNVIDRETWETLKRKNIKCRSWKSNRKLYSYGSEEPLNTAGEFEAELCYKDRKCTVTFVVVEEKARPILSRQTCEILAILKIEINSVSEENLLREFPRIFNGVGKLKDFQAKLHIDESVEPTAQKLRPPPFGLREKIEEKLEELVNHDVIEQVQGPTPWVSPVVVVPKPTGDIRLCVDMRKANRAIVRERHPIPTVDDVLYQLNGSTIFSKLDLKWGFHQIELEEQSRNITTFVTHKGLYRYKRLMFGISSAPELYQHTIQQVLAGCEGAYNIHDDIIIHGCSVDEHDARLKKTMGRIQEKGLTLNREKCVFQMSKLTFMGYLLSNKGIGPTESRVEAVVTAREPQNAGEVRSFLGLVNFSARFIPNLASSAEPLHRLTRRETPFVWGTEQQAAFDTLKSSLANAETLAYFDRNAEKTKLITDASPVGLGAVLTQVQGGCERVVAYASRSLTDVERRYSQTEKEALGLVWGCERFHMYLYGVEFTLLTDHKPLEVIYSTSSRTSARIERWVLRLQPYKFTVQYVPGKQNIADPLSRLSKGGGICMNSVAEEFIRFVAETSTPAAMSVQEVEKESWVDPEVSQLRECISTGDWDDAPSQYKAVRNELSTLGKLVLRGTRLLIPHKLRKRVLNLAHEGHQGLIKTKQRLRTKVWWAGIDKQVEDKCKTCHGCQLVGLPTPPEPLRHTEFPDQPWQDLAADLMGPLPSGEYVFVVVDYYSRYFEVEIMKSVTSTNVIESLEKIFCTHGLPKSLKTDNGPQFASEEFGSFLKANDIQHRTSTPLWPQANGEVERQNRSLLKVLKIAQAEKKNLWVEMRKFLTAYRTTPHSTTGVTPTKLLFNREIRSKIPELTTSGFADSQARDKDAETKQRRTDYADERRGAQENSLATGDQVLMKQRKENKLSTSFGETPHKVTSKYGNEVTVMSPEGVSYKRNVTELKKYLTGSEESDQQDTGQDVVADRNANTGTPEVSTRPARLRKPPGYLKDYELR